LTGPALRLLALTALRATAAVGNASPAGMQNYYQLTAEEPA